MNCPWTSFRAEQKVSSIYSIKALPQALMNNNVRVILCGQTAAAYEIDIKQLVEGVEIELSAMTAHALLQQDGFTINPF